MATNTLDKCMSWKQVTIGDPSSTQYLRRDERPLRQPAAGEVMVQIRACALNPTDYRVCMGNMSSTLVPPVIPGSDFAGIIVGAAPDTPFAKGDQVFGYCPNRWGRKRDLAAASLSAEGAAYVDAIGGCLSEYMIVPANMITRMPDALDFKQAASLVTSGMTCLDILELFPQQLNYNVVIVGASGGVGSLLTQLCSARGYRVWCVTREEHFEHCAKLGAHSVADYTKQCWSKYFAPNLELNEKAWVDAIIDMSGDGSGENWQLAKTVLVKSGTYCSLTWQDPDAEESGSAGIASYWQSAYRNVLSSFYFKYVQMAPTKEKLDTLVALHAGGHFKPILDTVYAFDGVHSAFGKLMSKRATGKLVVSFEDGDFDSENQQVVDAKITRQLTPPPVSGTRVRESTEDENCDEGKHEQNAYNRTRADIPYATTTSMYSEQNSFPNLPDNCSRDDVAYTSDTASPSNVKAPRPYAPPIGATVSTEEIPQHLGKEESLDEIAQGEVVNEESE